ncbi:conserved hypothetical protein [Nitrospina gracilis 3/211]|uniref:Glycosyltransferase n=1 Tax=Nitrospina gracilis (strain 3/211) TaxID=1266370 RepID=M1ZEL9_NITG3|nr:TIGR04282 family arsenosugar biosynthesis glycosyltransferase [Nitrospina gracilis]CCQ92032.1 conserved hypothetical protein [Nitrospina gracilis 3/211]
MGVSGKQAVILFARDPQPGKVKTRLQSWLDTDTTYRLYCHILEDSLRNVCAVEGVDRFVGIHPAHRSGFFDTVEKSGQVRLFEQEGEHLGARMRNAFDQRFAEGYETVVIIGSDSPTLPVSYIRQALDTGRDMTLGPCTDGGYYLIGMHRKVTDVFEGVEWGSEHVLTATLERVKQARNTLLLLPVWYDVDRPEDLRFLKTHLEYLQHTGLEGHTDTLRFLQQLNLNWESAV